jgi:hypothetical protein
MLPDSRILKKPIKVLNLLYFCLLPGHRTSLIQLNNVWNLKDNLDAPHAFMFESHLQ